MKNINEKYMLRCIELAKKGIGSVSPNPMVGSVIVYNNKIIGEGYHKKYGEPHAEVNAINSVKDKSLLKYSTIYVSLEPCSHYGKTPPCADLIIENNIPRVVIGSIDPNPKVAGKGIEKLQNAGIEVNTNILEKNCIELNQNFYTYHLKKRPYIILKWAETKDGFIDICRDKNSLVKVNWITNEYCKTLVHKWRTEEDSFLVGLNAVLNDNPQLTARNWVGKNPIRIVIDKNLEIPITYKVFDSSAKTLIFNNLKDECYKNIHFIKTGFDENTLKNIFEILYKLKIQSVVVEGGAITLNSFINRGYWDEARVFIGDKFFKNGVKAPDFNYPILQSFIYDNSILKIYKNPNNEF